MFTLLDNLIKKFLQNKFHANRDKMIFIAFSRFQKKYPEVSGEQLNELYKRLEKETVRVYSMSDNSILEARIETAAWNFWMDLLQNTITATLVCILSGSYYPLIFPLTNIIGNWVKSIATIHKSYNKRIKGGMNSVISTYVDELKLNIDENSPLLNKHSSYYKMQSEQLLHAALNRVSSPNQLQDNPSHFSMSLTTFLTEHNAKQSKDNSIELTNLPSACSESYSPI